MDRFEEILDCYPNRGDDDLGWLITEVERLRKIENTALRLDRYSSVDVDEWITLMGRVLGDNPRPVDVDKA